MKLLYSRLKTLILPPKSSFIRWMQKDTIPKELTLPNTILPPPEEIHYLSIKEDLKKARYALETAYLGFDNATDPDLIDCYIYEVNSVLKRYTYLLNLYSTSSQMKADENSHITSPRIESPL